MGKGFVQDLITVREHADEDRDRSFIHRNCHTEASSTNQSGAQDSVTLHGLARQEQRLRTAPVVVPENSYALIY